MNKEHHSAGGILLNKNKVFLIYKKSRDEWLLPKGTVDSGELNEETALREVIEETGFKNIEFISKNPVNVTKFTYIDDKNITVNKFVTYYLFKLIDDKSEPTIQMENEGLSGDWFEINDAIKKVTHDELKQTLTLANSILF